MNKTPYNGLRVILAEPRSSLRKEYLDVLKSLGCRDIIETGNIKDVHTALEEGGVDVLIGDATIPEGDMSELVHQIRHGFIGDNPFLIAMVMVSQSDKELIGRVIDSGADDILLKPLDTEHLRSRLLSFTSARKSFVVTSEYIGPDRQKKERQDGEKMPLLKVPNPLLVRMGGRHGSGVMKRAVDRTMNVVNKQKVERHAFTIHWLMERLSAVQNGDLPAGELNMDEQLKRLNEVARDLTYRLEKTDYRHAAEMCMTLEKMTLYMSETPELAGKEEITLLGKLTQVIKRKCSNDSPFAEASTISSPEGKIGEPDPSTEAITAIPS